MDPSAPASASTGLTGLIKSNPGKFAVIITVAVLVLLVIILSAVINRLRKRKEGMGDATMTTIYTSGADMRHLSDRTDTGGQTETMTGGRQDPYTASVAYRTYVNKDNMDASLNGTLEGLSVNRLSHHIENFASRDPLGETREESLQAVLY